MGQSGHKDQEPNIFQNSTSPTHASLFFEKILCHKVHASTLSKQPTKVYLAHAFHKRKYMTLGQVFMKASTKYLERQASSLRAITCLERHTSMV